MVLSKTWTFIMAQFSGDTVHSMDGVELVEYTYQDKKHKRIPCTELGNALVNLGQYCQQ